MSNIFNALMWSCYWSRQAEFYRQREQRAREKLIKEQEYRYNHDRKYREQFNAQHIQDGIKRAVKGYKSMKPFKKNLTDYTGMYPDEVLSLIDDPNNQFMVNEIARQLGISYNDYYKWLCQQFQNGIDRGEYWIPNY